ncbi:MAG: hypothetical protein Q8N88_01910 [Nanoarchaeota archaeon]|nr:hypothetical protein [Nanoarchaeota archaeon]
MANKKPTTANTDDSSKITTLKLTEETKSRIEKLREHKKESYDDILKKILYVLNVLREEPEKAKRILEKISEIRERMIQEETKQEENLKEEKENGGKNV